MAEELFSSLPERWSEISEFPGYSVSDRGRVMKTISETIVNPTVKNTGLAVVGLMRDGKQHKRSLTLLVATAYVPRPNEVFDTPINLDGDRLNNHFTNLTWRPLWFARKYNQQFTNDNAPYLGDPVEDVEARIVYDNIWTAAIHHGLLAEHIFVSMTNNIYVWPTGQVFRYAV